MNAFVRRLVAATLPVVSAVTLFAGSAPALADLPLPSSTGGGGVDQCRLNGGTPEQCAAQPTTIPSTQGGVKPSLTPIRRITNVRSNTITASSFGAARPAQLTRAR